MDGLTIGELPSGPRCILRHFVLYPEDAVRRVRFIKRAQELGFSLKDIKELLSLRAAPGAGCGEIRAHAEAKINDIDEKIRSLTAMKSALSMLVAECSGEGPLTECPILESLDTTEVTP
ncbi:MAG: MerR family DNA-binding protein [Candidatus Tectomicrobia bacterium]|nr:MerR family DNA-binding protein [Candidatus Tectomicrobia bacterium]